MNLIKAHYTPSKAVVSYSEIHFEAQELLNYIKEAHHSRPCYALHHTQVSTTPYNFFVLNPATIKEETFGGHIIVNPKIEHVDLASLSYVPEACMTFPHRKERNVERFARIQVKYQVPQKDASLKEEERELTDVLAQIFQHEVDHAQGKNIYYES